MSISEGLFVLSMALMLSVMVGIYKRLCCIVDILMDLAQVGSEILDSLDDIKEQVQDLVEQGNKREANGPKPSGGKVTSKYENQQRIIEQNRKLMEEGR